MRTSFKPIGAACAALAVLALPACSDGPTATGSVEILHWWRQGGEAQAIGALLGLFHDQYPGVTIVDASVDGSKLARASIGNRMLLGTPPDTFQANGGWDLMSWVLYNGKDARETKMMELDAASLDWIDQVPEPVLSSVSYEDKVYAVPLNIHRLNTFFYNKKVFADAGVDLAEDLGSFDGIFKVAEKIKAYNQTLPAGTAPITPFAMGFRATEGAMATDDTWTLALLFFENILVARMGGTDYHNLFLEPKADDAFQVRVTNALADLRQLVLYSNLDASSVPWNASLDMVLNGQAAMTIMGDWGKGYANAAGFDGSTFGVMPTPGTAKTFVFTTDTFGMPLGALHKEDTLNMLKVFGSREGQDVFNPIKGSISARKDSHIDDPEYDAMAKQTFDDFVHADVIVPATSIAAAHVYVDAISAVLADFAKARDNANPSTVQHTMDNYKDILLASCWPKPAANCLTR